MYRDDPLADEMELREVIGDEPVDVLVAARSRLTDDPVPVAIDALRVLQGWVDDRQAGRWFHRPQHRLDGQSPVAALCSGAFEEVLDAARAWAAARG